MPVVAAIIAFVVAALWASVGAAGLTRRLPRNRWLGVRSEETMRSERAFVAANRIAAPGMLGAAAILALSGVVALGVGTGWSLLFVVVGLVAALFVIGLVSAYAVRAAATLPADDAGCGSPCGSCTLSGMCSAESARA